MSAIEETNAIGSNEPETKQSDTVPGTDTPRKEKSAPKKKAAAPEKKKSATGTAKKTVKTKAKSKPKTTASAASASKGKTKPKRAWRKSTEILVILKRKKNGMTISELASAVVPGSPRQQKDEKLHRAVIAAAISRMYEKGLVKFIGGEGTRSDGYRYAAK